MSKRKYLIQVSFVTDGGNQYRVDIRVDEAEHIEYLNNPEKWIAEQVRKYLIARLLKI